MPYRFETLKLKIRKEHDKRRKLDDYEKDQIKQFYGEISQRKLAKMFGVSRSLVRFVGDPEKHKQNLLRREERGGSMRYYDKEQQRKYTKKHRDYKRMLDLKNLLLKA